MVNKKRKAIMDDGMNPELVRGARFDGVFEIPIVEKPADIIIPEEIIPFSKIHNNDISKAAVGFYEMDPVFADILISPQDYTEIFSKAMAVISPDCSLYRDAPLTVQIANVYRNRAIGHYFQYRGIYVIPQVRWGNELTYTTTVFPEKIAFLGVEKHSIVSIGSYGCIKSREDKYYFQAGLDAMLETLEPKVVLVYGSKSPKVFDKYENYTHFIQYLDWTTRRKAGD
ncbi:MAG: DUF4417 domain-containing protein [Clostridiales bacterium]|nr:DUF4417 domain-containing protein [Clostridiales bacterium]